MMSGMRCTSSFRTSFLSSTPCGISSALIGLDVPGDSSRSLLGRCMDSLSAGSLTRDGGCCKR